MKRKKAFSPGDMVTSFTGQCGMVISEEVYLTIKNRMKEGKRPGYYFSPGCCQRPDYVTQVPVLFEDTTWDVMRAMNIRKTLNVSGEKRLHIQSMIDKKSR